MSKCFFFFRHLNFHLALIRPVKVPKITYLQNHVANPDNADDRACDDPDG